MERTDHTLIKLRQMIANNPSADEGRIPPERSLASKLGVGRRSLRKALEILEQEGRISRHQGRGTFVNSAGHRPANGPGSFADARAEAIQPPALPAYEHILEHTNPLEVIEVRLSIEPAMARLAAFRASQVEIKRLKVLAEETRLAKDAPLYREADARFHRAVAEMARNALFLSVFDMLQASQCDVATHRLGENANCYKRQSVYADFHHEISKAIAARQGDKAQELMYQHLSDVQRYIFGHAFPAGMAQQ